MKKFIICIAFLVSAAFFAAADLSIGPKDIFITQSPEGGYHLYIRKKPGIDSVLLTETTRDPELKADNYAYRSLSYHPVNGDEKRMLDGAFIPPEKNLWSLIDSTPELTTPIGEAFHIWIPYVIAYGYEWSRQAEVQVLDGTYLNIRAFEKPYGDYSGAFTDNPYRLRVTQKPIVGTLPVDTIYMEETVKTFSSLAEKTSGQVLYAKTPQDVIPVIKSVLQNPGPRPLELVFVIDATESMVDEIKEVREMIEPMLKEMLPSWPAWRVALVLYKDYFEDFLTRVACNFTDDLTVFRKSLNNFRVQGGRDIPEAVYEGLDTALALPWIPGSDRKIILIGDAPPHPKPRGRITQEMVENAAKEKSVQMNVIILPHGNTY
ncbi:MAG TPA: VWA domain-containing protein [Treponema sp.]|nr:VWA domain-containing protein [Treponema sp.]